MQAHPTIHTYIRSVVGARLATVGIQGTCHMILLMSKEDFTCTILMLMPMSHDLSHPLFHTIILESLSILRHEQFLSAGFIRIDWRQASNLVIKVTHILVAHSVPIAIGTCHSLGFPWNHLTFHWTWNCELWYRYWYHL